MTEQEMQEVRDELLAEALRGFFFERHLPTVLIDRWADEVVAIVMEHR